MHGLIDRRNGLVCPAFGPEAVGARMKIRLPDRHQEQTQRRLHHPVFDRRNAQRPLAAAAFWNHHPAYRTGPVGLGFEFRLQPLQPLLAMGRLGVDGRQTLAIHPRLTAVSKLCLQGRFEHVQAQQLPIQTPEPIFRCCLGFPIERDLKLPNFIRGYYPGCPGHPRVLRFASTH
jgi:hypothetical protein